ncbi:MAG: TSUP family transporter [Coriobacteriales bacterium]|nr:TSUP family transporter [Coriobacteriales bacterium]
MELFWYVVAAVGAGVGTGLAGLSAATIMVPILIVLCPSFAGANGPFQATAIALASDILGSAVASYTYARHKNIDLKRGWIMLACILSMCAVGSYVAYLAGDVVLGNFTLFLTLAIGIRFLVKPDTSREKQAQKGQRLDAKGVLISLFFGLTIGFGAGFVGTGGGMMMLVVFTAFLGMELKTAVGTSTFIMTFTALIASVSHMLIDPAIILEKWPVLLLCVVVTTLTSLLSARLANRLSNRTVGLATGAVLTVLGGSMLLLKYWPQLALADLAGQVLQCFGRLALYIIPCVLLLLALRFFTRVPKFVFRKLLHAVAFSCFVVMQLTAQSWQAAALTCIVVAAVVYPLLALAEKSSWYAGLFVQKSPGEIKRSLLMLFFMFAGVITLAWGICGKPFAAAAAILMWGVGDAAAALVGIPFGRHKVMLWPVRGKKSWEGSAVMLAASLLVGLVLLAGPGGYALPPLLPKLLLAALVGTITELCSPSELDTITVPIAILAVLLPLL